MPGLIDVPHWAKSHPYVYLWGKYMGSPSDYIENEVRKAQRMTAPDGATYERDGRWHTTEDMTNPNARAALGLDWTALSLARWFTGEVQVMTNRAESLNATLRKWEDSPEPIHNEAMFNSELRQAVDELYELATVLYRKTR